MDTRLTADVIASLQRSLAGSGTPAASAAPAGASFAAALGDALKTVSQAQVQSSELQRRFQAGVDGVSLEETMVAMQKAQIGFQAALTVRNRLVSAYTDIMNMQV
jgi:flagellar hook-basal body complex protein FliE